MEKKAGSKPADIAVKIIKWIFLFLFGILGLFLVVFVVLQIPQVQDYITGRIVRYVSNKTGTEIKLESVKIAFPKYLSINKLYIEDQQHDTLLYADNIKVDVDLTALLWKEININALKLNGVTGHIQKSEEDSSYNFNFIVNAFASDTSTTNETEITETDTTAENGWTFSIDDITLDNIYFTYKDHPGGMHMKYRLGYLNLEFDEFDLDEQKIITDLLEVNNSLAIITYTRPQISEEDTSEPIEYDVGVNKIILSEVKFEYNNQPEGQQLTFDINDFTLRGNRIDLTAQEIDLNEITLSQSKLYYRQDPVAPPPADTTAVANADTADFEGLDIGWKVRVDKFDFNNNTISFISGPAQQQQQQQQQQGPDYNNLALTNLTININDIYFSDSLMKADINEFQFREKSGLDLKHFSTNVLVNEQKAELANLDLQFNNSIIQRHIEVQYPSLEEIQEKLGQVVLNVRLQGSRIAIQDLLYFQPDLASNPYIQINRNKTIRLAGTLTGPVDNLVIDGLNISTASATLLKASGNIKNLPDMDNAWFDIKLDQLSTTQGDIGSLLPDTTLPPDIDIPASIYLTGNFTGSLEQFKAQADLATSMGNASASFNMAQNISLNQPAFNTTVNVDGFDIGDLLNQEANFGKATLTLQANGTGSSMDNLSAEMTSHIRELVINQYAYNDIDINGSYEQNVLTVSTNIQDPNLTLHLNGQMTIDTNTVYYLLDLDLNKADLQALNFSEKPLAVRANLNADISGSNANNINGNMSIRNVRIVQEGKSYTIDSLLVASIEKERVTDISVRSDFLSAQFKGTINIGDLPTELQKHLNHYFAFAEDTPDEAETAEQQFNFNIDIKKPDILTEVLMPGLEEFVPGQITGSYNSRERDLQVNLLIPLVQYDQMRLDSFYLVLNSNEKQLNYSTGFQTVGYGEDYYIINTNINGYIEQDSIVTHLNVSDSAQNKQYVVPLLFQKESNTSYKLKILPGQLVLNYERWNVSDDNYLLLTENQLNAHNLELRNEDQLLEINTYKENIPLSIQFSDFRIATLTNLVQSDKNLFSGVLDGIFQMESLEKGTFTADLDINHFAFREDTLGNIHLEADKDRGDRYNILATIEGQGNDIEIDGYYAVQENVSVLNLLANLNRVNLSTFEAYTFGQLTQLRGILEGHLNITGSVGSPDINGELTFNNTEFFAEYLGSSFSLNNERIAFNNQGVVFNNFTIRDADNNKANINGRIMTGDFTDLSFDLSVNTNDFLLINTNEEDNELYYGKVIVDSDIDIKGDMLSPVINMRASLEKGSNLTFVVPETEPATIEREGIVEFADMGTKDTFDLLSETETSKDDTLRSELRNVSLNANIDIDRATTFKMVIDQEAGDYLLVNGGASLSMSINPSGNISITGRYNITGGEYRLSFYDLVRKEFEIQEGSIIWQGDPLDARIDLHAVYEVYASPEELIAGQLAANTAENAQFQEKLPFEVHMYMQGSLEEPKLNFEIMLDESRRGAMSGSVYASLQNLNQNEAELNKQVFALLVLNRFLPRDPFSPDGSEGAPWASAARTSVSNLLTQQLNRLSEKYISGVELDFNVRSFDEAGGGDILGRTEVGLNLSKSFLNERVNVRVGANVELQEEGISGRQQQAGLSDFAGDVIVEYLLTRDGRYKLRLFRLNQYEGLIEGEVIETGASFIFNRDYDTLKELFRKTEKETEQPPEEEEEKEISIDGQLEN